MEEAGFHQFGRFYPISDVRSEPMSAFTSTRQIVSLSTPPTPPLWTAPSPVKIRQGLWRDGDDFLRSSDWPPVQQYLSETSKNRRLALAPSETVFALAALEVLHQPHNPVHWLFWGTTCLLSTSKTVNKIARTFSWHLHPHFFADFAFPLKVHRPRLIKTDVPWIGISEYKRVISAIQEKWEYVHIRKRWYPVDGQPEISTKRHLRSSGDRGDQTVNSYFNLPEDGEPPSKRTRRTGRKAVEMQDPCTTDRPNRAKVEQKPSPSSTSTTTSNVASIDASIPGDAPVIRASARKRLKTTSSTKSPPPSLPALSSAAEISALPVASSLLSSTTLMAPVPSHISPPSSSHSRNRSTSQSSAETLVDSDQVQLRSASVTSTDTAVENSLSKKRKWQAVEEECLELDLGEMAESNRREGMVTRARASKFHLVETNAEKSVTRSSRSSTPAKVEKTVEEKPKPRARKSRVKK